MSDTTKTNEKQIKHPAKYTNSFIPIFAEKLRDSKNVIDIFAGTCKISKIKEYGYRGKIYCNELEKEWVEQGLGYVDAITTLDAEFLPYKDGFFDAICTSPTYGNRMADHHNAKDGSRRNTYTHTIGRDLTEGNTGKMQWGTEYKQKHISIWKEAYRILKVGGILILNVSDHIRKGEVINVSEWHKDTLISLGFNLQEEIKVETPRLRYGANANKRVDYEYIHVFSKPSHTVIQSESKDTLNVFANLKDLVWESDYLGSEIGFPQSSVVGMYTKSESDGEYSYYIDAEKRELLDIWKS